MKSSNLFMSDFYAADLEQSNLSFSNLSHVHFAYARMRRDNLSNSDLYQADLYKVDLENADLENANLTDANLGNADLCFADLRNANLSGANLSGANRCKWREVRPVEDGISRARLDPDVGERFLSLRRPLGVTSFGINQIVLEPRQRGRIHRHERQEEVYLVLEGTLTLLIEGDESQLGAGELVRVAPAVRRQLVNRGPGRLVLLALGGAGDHQGRDGEAFASWEQESGVSPQELPLPPDL
jgi:mannose-6-phosphate isomerase-like protein (cupin superfamily)